MKKILLSISVLVSTFAYSQETHLVRKGRPIVKGEPGFHEEYYVLAADKKVKHGPYSRLITKDYGLALETIGNYSNGKKNGQWQSYYGTSNNIKEAGFYKNDLQDSTWEYYYPEGKDKVLVEVASKGGKSLKIENANPVLGIKGQFREGKRVGVWEYYNMGEIIIMKFDYDTREVLYMKNDGPDNFKSGYLGDDFFLNQQLNSTFDYNELLNSIKNRKSLKSGKLVFTFWIDEHCNLTNILCSEKTITNKKIYERAMSTIQALDGHYFARKQNGKNVAEVKTITFELMVKSKTNFSISNQTGYRQEFSFSKMFITVK